MEPQTQPHLSEALHPRRSRNHRIGGASPGLPDAYVTLLNFLFEVGFIKLGFEESNRWHFEGIL